MTFLKLEDLEERELVPGYRVRFLHTENMTFAYWMIDEGAPMPEHSHPHEQVSNILEGRFELVVEGNRQVLEPAMVAVIPPNAPHSGTALTDCKLLDIFYPPRDDYR